MNPRKRNYAISPLIVSVFMAVACLGATFWLIIKVDKLVDIPEGCDAFGYLRQARLFVDRGFVRGLDTGMEDRAAQLIIELSKNSGTPVEKWYQGVAPHAHHYNVRTGKIILQYPPGTGFFMSLFPEGGRNKGCMLFAGELVIAFAWTLTMAARSAIPATSVVAICSALILSALINVGRGSSSIPVTIGLIVVLCFLLGVALKKEPSSRGRLVLALACGLVFGALVDVRLPNALVFPGVALCLCFGTGRQRMVLSLAAFGFGASVALAPLGWANIINAGGLLHTCYSPMDASWPTFSLPRIIKAARYYAFVSSERVCLPLALFCIMLSLRRSPIVAYAGLIVTVAEITYFFTHEILIFYYLFPGICFVVFLCLTGIAQDRK